MRTNRLNAPVGNSLITLQFFAYLSVSHVNLKGWQKEERMETGGTYIQRITHIHVGLAISIYSLISLSIIFLHD